MGAACRAPLRSGLSGRALRAARGPRWMAALSCRARALRRVRRRADADAPQRAADRTRSHAAAAWRSPLFLAARAVTAGSSDGLRQPLDVRSRSRRLGGLSHRTGRRRHWRSPQGPSRRSAAAPRAALAADCGQPALRRHLPALDFMKQTAGVQRRATPAILIGFAACWCLSMAASARAQDTATSEPAEAAFTLSTSEVFTTKDSPSFSLTFRHLTQLDFRVY